MKENKYMINNNEIQGDDLVFVKKNYQKIAEYFGTHGKYNFFKVSDGDISFTDSVKEHGIDKKLISQGNINEDILLQLDMLEEEKALLTNLLRIFISQELSVLKSEVQNYQSQPESIQPSTNIEEDGIGESMVRWIIDTISENMPTEGYGYAYMLFRMAEYGYIPKEAHNINFFRGADEKGIISFFKGLVWDKTRYLLAGGPLTKKGGAFNLGKLNFANGKMMLSYKNIVNEAVLLDIDSIKKLSMGYKKAFKNISSNNSKELLASNDLFDKQSVLLSQISENINNKGPYESLLKSYDELVKGNQIIINKYNELLSSKIILEKERLNKKRLTDPNMLTLRNEAIADLDNIEKEITKGDLKKVNTLLSDYSNKYNAVLKGTTKNPLIIDDKLSVDNGIKEVVVDQELETNKKKLEIETISKELDLEETKLKSELKRLDKLATDLPPDSPELKQARLEAENLVKSYNEKVIVLESKGVSGLKSLTAKEINSLSNVKWVNTLLKANGGVQGFLEKGNNLIDTKINGNVGKGLLGVAVFTMLVDEEKLIDGFTKFETYKDMGSDCIDMLMSKDGLDLIVGFLPVAGGVHDLILGGNDVCFIPDDWEDKYREWFGKEDISEYEKKIRTGFGIIGLIPGVGIVGKASGKGLSAVGKTVSKHTALKTIGNGLGYTSKIIYNGTETLVSGAQLVSKVAIYSALGFSVGHTLYSLSNKYLSDGEVSTIE